MARPNSLQSKIENRITESREYVFLTREFTDLSGRRQVSARVTQDRGRRPARAIGMWRIRFGDREWTLRTGLHYITLKAFPVRHALR